MSWLICIHTVCLVESLNFPEKNDVTLSVAFLVRNSYYSK